MKISNRLQSYLIITLCYMAAALVGMWVFQTLPTALWLSLLIADLAATLLIWLLSQLLNNASVYDPYWSVQPPIILLLTMIFLGKPNLGSILLVIAVAFWGARLSINWMITFYGLHQQDWRYDQLKQKSGGVSRWSTCWVSRSCQH
jgi:steroid 5-alpha reductase family enzyme